MARVVAVAARLRPPARRHRSPATARRRCRPPGWRSTRSRPARATCSSRPASRWCPGSPRATPTACRRTRRPLVGGGWQNPRSPRPGPHRRAARRRPAGTTRARTATLPDIYIAMGQTAENLAQLKGVTRAGAWTSSASASQNLAEKAIADGFWAREITPVTLPDGTVVVDRRRPARRASPSRRVAGLKPVFRPDGRVTAGNCCPLNDGAAAVVDHERHQGRASWASPRWPGSSPPASPRCRPEIMGLGPVEASRQALTRAGMTIDDIDLVEINEAFAAQVIPSYRDLGIPTGQAQRQRRRDRGRPPVRHDRRPHHRHADQLRCRLARQDRSAWRRCASAAARAWRWSSSALS